MLKSWNLTVIGVLLSRLYFEQSNPDAFDGLLQENANYFNPRLINVILTIQRDKRRHILYNRVAFIFVPPKIGLTYIYRTELLAS